MTFPCKEHFLLASTGTHLSRRSGCSIIHTPTVSVMFGGQIWATERKSNELWWITRNRLDWHMQLTFGDIPVAMSDHAAVFDHKANRSELP